MSASLAATSRAITMTGKRHADVQANSGSDKARTAVAALLEAIKDDLNPKVHTPSGLAAAAKRVVSIDADKEVQSNSLRLTFKALQHMVARHQQDLGVQHAHVHDQEAVADAKRHMGRAASGFLKQPQGRQAGARMTFNNARAAVGAARAVYGDMYREPKRVGAFCDRDNRAQCHPAAAPSSTQTLEPKIHHVTKPGGARLRRVTYTHGQR